MNPRYDTGHVAGPFGGCDEQAETDAYERLCGGVSRAQRLFRLYIEHKRNPGRFERVAQDAGFTEQQVAALRHLG